MAAVCSSLCLTENNIHNWVGEAQFNRGLQYVREALVLPYSHRRRVIQGWCRPRDGQSGTYFVRVRCANLHVAQAHCTCPLGKYGICPHVAAVLTQFVRQPESFPRGWWHRLMMLISKPAPALQPIAVVDSTADEARRTA